MDNVYQPGCNVLLKMTKIAARTAAAGAELTCSCGHDALGLRVDLQLGCRGVDGRDGDLVAGLKGLWALGCVTGGVCPQHLAGPLDVILCERNTAERARLALSRCSLCRD